MGSAELLRNAAAASWRQGGRFSGGTGVGGGGTRTDGAASARRAARWNALFLPGKKIPAPPGVLPPPRRCRPLLFLSLSLRQTTDYSIKAKLPFNWKNKPPPAPAAQVLLLCFVVGAANEDAKNALRRGCKKWPLAYKVSGLEDFLGGGVVSSTTGAPSPSRPVTSTIAEGHHGVITAPLFLKLGENFCRKGLRGWRGVKFSVKNE